MPNQVIYSFIANERYIRVARRIARATVGVRRAMKDLGPAATRAGLRVKAAFAGMGRAVKGFMRSLGPLIAAFAGVAGAMKFAALGTGFEDAMADLQAITGAAGKDLQFLKNQSMSLGEEARVSASDVAEGFKLVASAKPELLKNTEALAQMTKEVLLLKNATGLEMADAANVTAVALNQFGEGADQAGRFVNVLAAGSKFGASEVQQTGAAILESGVAATLAGVKFEELNGAIQTLAIGGEKGRRAGTGLKTAIIQLDKALAKSGLGGIEKVGGLAPAFEILKNANLDLAQLTEIFGTEAVKVAGILVKNTDILNEQTAAVTGTNVAMEQADIRMRTLSSRARGASVVLQNKLLAVFEGLKPQLSEGARGLRAFAESISPETIEKWTDRLKLAIRAFQVLGKVVGVAFAIVGPFIAVLLLPIRALVATLEKLFEVANAVKLLGGFASEAIGDFLGDKLNIRGNAKLESSSNTTIGVKVAADPGSQVTEFQSKTTTSGPGLDVGVSAEGALP